MIPIFDRDKLRIHRNKSVPYINQCKFFKYAIEDITDRLNLIDKNFLKILDLGCRTGYLTKLLSTKYQNSKIIATDISEAMLESFLHNHKILLDEEKLTIHEYDFDLITFSLGIHWINDVIAFLKQIKAHLKPDGIFIANFVGGNSLKQLRTKIIQAEIATNHAHSAHIAPFIHFDHVVPLLTQAGFDEIIVDAEDIELQYSSPLKLMQSLKKIGESNILVDAEYYSITQQMFYLLSNDKEPFHEQINLISLIASPMKNSIKLKTLPHDVIVSE